MKKIFGEQTKSDIVVAYRDAQGKKMHGAFYDHYLLRRITQHETVIAKSGAQTTDKLVAFIKNTTLALGISDTLGERITPLLARDNPNRQGLLVIPGRGSHVDDAAMRNKNESLLIKEARLRGQPIFAVCGGASFLYRCFGGKVESVEDHAYRMPWIRTNGYAGNNVEVHDLSFSDDALITKGAMQMGDKESLFVNSVHWDAPSSKDVPDTLEIAGIGTETYEIVKKNRQGEELNPDDCVESFESKYGAPIIGVMWHPEAYYEDEKQEKNSAKHHLALVTYMAKAGDAYCAKRAMLSELGDKFGIQ